MKNLDASSFENQFYVVFSHLKNVLNEEKRKRCHQAGTNISTSLAEWDTQLCRENPGNFALAKW